MTFWIDDVTKLVQVFIEGNVVTVKSSESLLEALERSGIAVPNACRSGVCQSCLLQAVKGQVPAASQKGLKPALALQGYFLACQCYPEQNLEAARPDSLLPTTSVEVLERAQLADDVFGLRLGLPGTWMPRPGQYVHVSRNAVMRSYSVASLPEQDRFLELHVRRMPGGLLSQWLCDSCVPGMSLDIRGPLGECFYTGDGAREFPIVLAGTSTGLAPLEGIARDALQQGHRGKIILIHGAREASGLYHQASLKVLQEQHAQFEYRPAVMSEGSSGDIIALTRSVLDALGPADARLFVCGAPELVNILKRQSFLQGVGSARIHSDPFVTAPPPIA